jgi:hypothetical protein
MCRSLTDTRGFQSASLGHARVLIPESIIVLLPRYALRRHRPSLRIECAMEAQRLKRLGTTVYYHAMAVIYNAHVKWDVAAGYAFTERCRMIGVLKETEPHLSDRPGRSLRE